MIPRAICPDRLMTQSGPDASAQFVGRAARSSGNVGQPDHVLANQIAGRKAERRPGAGEETMDSSRFMWGGSRRGIDDESFCSDIGSKQPWSDRKEGS